MGRILFAQALAIAPHFSLGGLLKMIYEHFLGCFIPEDPSSRFSKLFQTATIVAHGDILRLMALMLGANRLLAMAKDIGGLCLITVSEVFLRLISRSIVLHFGGHFKSTYPPISLEYRPLEVVRPSLLTFKPSSTYTLIRS
jgi:hypothetical protein